MRGTHRDAETVFITGNKFCVKNKYSLLVDLENDPNRLNNEIN